MTESNGAYEAPDAARIVCTDVHSAIPPPEVVAFITRYGGINRFGDPNFRIVWGGSRLCWKTARYNDKDEHGNVTSSRVECRWTPKYRKLLNHWVLEYWKSPEDYFDGDADMWYQKSMVNDRGLLVPTKAAFPSRGDYEYLDYFCGLDGVEFAQPEIPTAKYAIDCARHLKHGTNRVQFTNDKQREAEKADRDETLDIYTQIKDATKPSTHQPWLSMAT